MGGLASTAALDEVAWAAVSLLAKAVLVGVASFLLAVLAVFTLPLGGG